ncbi:MAG: LPS export ABC transporter periplasmic protein LptC [Cyclobacteriaceae bacterium]
MNKTLLWITLAAACVACDPKETAKPVIYDGPMRVGEEVEMLRSEKGVVQVKLKAKKVLEFQNGDRDFPEGLYLEFYNEFHVITSTLRANSAHYSREDDLWKGQGNVEVKNIEKKQQLNSEELFWNPKTKKIYTDKFVTVRDQEDVIYGTGLDAAQDMSVYNIHHIEGEFAVQEDSTSGKPQ